MASHFMPVAPEDRGPIVVLDGQTLKLIDKFPHLIRKSDGDEAGGSYLKINAWSALRMLSIIGMDSEDDDDVCIAGEKAEEIAAIISKSLDVAESSSSACMGHCHRLCCCRRHVELGHMALMLGKKFWLPLIGGQYSGTGSSERAMLRTFFLSTVREYVVTLEFEVLSKRADRSRSTGQVPKVTVELADGRVSLETEIDNKGIIRDTTDD